jgi:NTE family protein
VLQGLTEQGVVFDAYVGSSTGAIQAGWMALADGSLEGQWEQVMALRDLWFGLKGQGDVWANGVLRGIWRVLRGKPSIGHYGPFRKLLKQHIHTGPRLPVCIAVVSLDTGRYMALQPLDARSFQTAILASCSNPILQEPVGPAGWLDGGLREISPLAEAFRMARQSGADDITLYLINTTPLAGSVLADEPSGKDWRQEKMLPIGERALWILTHEIIQDDINRMLELNELVRWFDERLYLRRPPSLEGKVYAELVRHDIRWEDAPYGTFEFDPVKLRAAWAAGYERVTGV